jgi:hypothetical protein
MKVGSAGTEVMWHEKVMRKPRGDGQGVGT